MQIIQMLLIGIVTGVMAGLFGIGGGIILVPILVLLMKLPQQTASGTSLVALLLPVGIFGVMEYYKAGKIGPLHIRYGLMVAVGMFLGTYFGSVMAVELSPTLLRRGFAGFMGLVAIKMWLG